MDSKLMLPLGSPDANGKHSTLLIFFQFLHFSTNPFHTLLSPLVLPCGCFSSGPNTARWRGGLRPLLPVKLRASKPQSCWNNIQPTGGAQFSRHQDRKSTRLNSSHLGISYAVFCL